MTAKTAAHFAIHPDEINSGDVGTLNHSASVLRHISESDFREASHAA